MHFLPYGTVVCVKDIEYPLMIVDWTAKVYKPDSKHTSILKSIFFNDALRAIDNATREFTLHDYLGCPWPRGFILDEEAPEDKKKGITRVPFNHEDIESVLFIGPFDDVFIGHDEVSFEFACENNMAIANFYKDNNEIDVQTSNASREEPYKISSSSIDAMLPIGSVVVKEFPNPEGGGMVKKKIMISSIKPPFFVGDPDYEFFPWESGSVFTDDMNLATRKSDVIEVISLGYVNAETQALLSEGVSEEFRLPLLEEILRND